ncbi:hypothetical protein [Loktanella sp. SALINAS62]|uniref:hypothetical protein n=1 Tax=Loktanella sp. SALINAS62 TaxID=2706124 RepID=UPI001B8BA6DA|nr:hypothetical protein [Loktanella sp. SALINAS62]MBS1302013.1 hypothetical protein [Loktanella sp. SALINAS62]
MQNLTRRSLLSLICAAPLALPGRLFAQDAPIKLRDLYNRDMSFSDIALAHEGLRITIAGFMAPPLKAESDFFVLTKMPMAVCPFCEPGTPWPDDILAVYTKRIVNVVPFNVPLETTGVLDLGEYVDPELGFYSEVRLTDAVYGRA